MSELPGSCSQHQGQEPLLCLNQETKEQPPSTLDLLFFSPLEILFTFKAAQKTSSSIGSLMDKAERSGDLGLSPGSLGNLPTLLGPLSYTEQGELGWMVYKTCSEQGQAS